MEERQHIEASVVLLPFTFLTKVKLAMLLCFLKVKKVWIGSVEGKSGIFVFLDAINDNLYTKRNKLNWGD